MEILERALKQALDRNAAETVRWTKYKEQHEEAKQNIEKFTKSLEVDIMVPIGSKALMPGRLYHTNEIVVSHSRSYYSECTAHKALEICQNRLNVAESRLNALEVEGNLHRNQLELPNDFGAFSSQEIIEAYDEEEEKKWQVNHKKKIKEHKRKEAIERQQISSGKAEDDIIKRLEELELMEELENELEAIAEEDDEAVQAVLSERPEQISVKKRISHFNDRNTENAATSVDRASMENAESTKTDNPSSSSSDEDDREDDDDDEIPAEFKELERQSASMSNREKTKLFKTKFDEVQKYLEVLKPRTIEDISHKTDMMFLSDHLLNAIEMLEDEYRCDRYLNAENVTTEDSDNIASNVVVPTNVPKQTILKKKTSVSFDDDKSSRKIRFASEDDVKSFDVLEEPSKISSASPAAVPTNVPKQTILKKKTSVSFDDDKSSRKIRFASEDDVKSFDVLEEPSKISSTVIYDRGPVLQLNVNHSEAVFHDTNERSDVIRSPVDIYKQFASCTTSQPKKETKRSLVQTDNPLSNRSAAQQIKHSPVDPPKPKAPITAGPRKIKQDSKEITEDPKEIKEEPGDKDIAKAKDEVKDMLDNMFGTKNPNEPDPLPEGNFVDSHAPKKRVSLFKQRRQMKGQ